VVDVVVAAHVDHDALDRAAGEGERRGVVGGDGRAAVAADADAVAGEREVAGLGHDLALGDLFGIDVEGQGAGRAVRVGVVPRLAELGRQDVVSGGDRFRRADGLDPLAEPVVDVVQPAVLQV
jgi:hypothetical protein